MSALTLPVKNMSDIDLTSICGNWEKVTDFTEGGVEESSYRSMPVRSSAINSCIAIINSVAISNPRHLFGSGGFLNGDYTSGQPYQLFYYPDLNSNVRALVFKILYLPPAALIGPAYIQRDGDSTVNLASATYLGYDGPGYIWPEDMRYVELVYNKDGFTPSASTVDGISTAGDIRIIDMVVEEEPIHIIDTDIHDIISGHDVVYPGREITTLELGAEIRSVQHAIRSTNLGIIACFAARLQGTSYITPGSTDENGLVTASTSFVNVLDQTVTTRTAQTPGHISHIKYSGVGLETSVQGRKCYIRGKILAAATTNDGEVKLIGPDHVGSNDDTITITAGSAAWYNITTGVLLDALADDDDTTTGRSKIDIHFRMTGAGTLYVYAYNLWIEYS